MADIAGKIAAAKKAGYSDADIAAHLGKDSALAPKIQAARQAGYKDADIIGYLTKDTPQSRADRDAGKLVDVLNGRLPNGAKLPEPMTRFTRDTMSRARGASLGWLDEVAGGVSALATGATNALAKVTGRPGLGYGMNEAYNATRNVLNNEAQKDRSSRPVSTMANEVVGGMWLPGPKTTNALKVGAYGAGVGAVAGAGEGDGVKDRLRKGAIGAATGFGVAAGLQGASNAMARSGAAAAARPPSNARKLAEEGVQLTPGQMLGGTAQRVEDAATSIPLVGDAIRSRRVEGIQSFNKAAINRALSEIGDELPKGVDVGREGIDYASKAVSNAYERALAPVQLAPDADFVARAGKIAQEARLTPEMAQEYESVVKNLIAPNLGREISGRDWKVIDSDLGSAIASASTAAGQKASARYLANALGALKDEWKGLLLRSSPETAEAVARADAANANLVRLREAAQQVGAKGGVFTPAQLNRAVRSGDSSAGNRAFATGNALMQDLTDKAVDVLPSTVPDSGTALRSVLTGLGTGGGAVAGINALGGPALPAAIVAGGTTAGGMALYSRPVQRLLNDAYRASSPGAARKAISELQGLAARNAGLQAEIARAIADLTGRSDDRAGRPLSQASPSR